MFAGSASTAGATRGCPPWSAQPSIELRQLLAPCGDAFLQAQIHLFGAAADIWSQGFRNSQGKGKWQELQLVASIIGLCAARAVMDGDDLDDLLDECAPTIRTASASWQRPAKTQSREQWLFISRVVGELLEILGVSSQEAHERIARQFGESGLEALLDVSRRA